MNYLTIRKLKRRIDQTKNNRAGKYYLQLRLSCFLLMGLLLSGISTATVNAASGLKIYDYTTKQTSSYTGKTVKVICNNITVSNPKYPGILVNGIALVPYNEVFSTSKIKADCVYNSKSSTILISKYNKQILMKIGSQTATVNGKVVTMPAAPIKIKYIASNKTRVLVPSRFVAETLGLGYNWYSDKNTIEIMTNITNTIVFSYNNGDQYEYSGAQGKVSVDGKNVNLSGNPSIIINDTAMLSAYNVFAKTSINADYSYNKKNKTITLRKDGIKLVMKLGSKTAYLNNSAITLTTAPAYSTNYEGNSSYVVVPGEFTASSLGYNYKWNNSSKTSIITKRVNNTSEGSISSNNSSGDDSSGGNSSDGNSTGGNTSDSNASGSNTSGSNTSGGNTAGGNASSGNASGSNTSGGNSSNSSTSGNNTSGGNIFNSNSSSINSGASGDFSTTGTILNQWTATNLQYATSSGINEWNSDPAFSNSNGYIYSISRDYTKNNKNAETFQITANGPFQRISSSKTGNTTTILAESMRCVEQSNQLYGTSSNFVNTLSSSYDSLNNRAMINLDAVQNQYQYDIALSADRSILYVTVYYSTITSALIGTNSTADYIQLNGTSVLNATSNDTSGMLYIELPYTINSLGDINTSIIGAKYIKQVTVVTLPDKTQLILSLNAGYQYYASSNGNQYTIYLQTKGDSGSTGYPNAAVNSNYEVVIPKPANLTLDMVSDEDYYLKHYFEISIKGDYTGSIHLNTITNNASSVSNISVTLNSNGNTVIRFDTVKIQGYKIAIDTDHIYVKIGDPGDIYKNIVVLDPGHGGSAPGTSYSGGYEKDLNFNILYTLGKKYFNKDSSTLKVYYTRTDDSNPSLRERAAFAASVDADLFVSLHMNSAPVYPSANGTEVYYSQNNNSANTAGLTSKTLAGSLIQNLTNELGTNSRGVKSNIYTVIDSNTVPAVLIELGFLTNKDDFNMILDETCQELAAETIYNTLLQIFSTYPTGR
jgi:N-acetylmuramoyl-L-alanine amidase